jgi:hypothetical protein
MMPPDPRQIEEWLSGLLDGELSEQEQRDLDAAMRNDPSIAERLEEMTNLRRALLQGRSVGRLGSDFATKIVQVARHRASEMDAPPAWILPDAPNAVAPRTQDTLWQEDELPSERSAPLSVELVASGAPSKPKMRGIMGAGHEPTPITPTTPADRFLKIWLPSLAVVLALCALVLFLPRNGSDVTVTKNPSTPEGPGTIADASPQESPTLEKPRNNLIVQSDEQDNPTSPKPIPELPGPKSPASNSPEKIADAPQAVPNNGVKQLPPKIKTSFVAFVSVDKVARENGMLTQLLDQYEIIYSEDVVLKDEARQEFADSLIVKLKADLNVKDAKLYVVKGTLARISSFMQDVEKQKADFPDYQLSMTSSPIVFDMIGQLDGLHDALKDANPQKPNGKRPSNQDEGYLILVVRDSK